MVGANQWLRKNIFNGVANSLLSLTIVALVVILLWKLFTWAVLNGVWNAHSVAECHQIVKAAHGADASGACWAVLKGRIGMFLFGFYPPELYWRPVIALLLMFVALAPLVFKFLSRRLLWFALIYPFIAYYLIWGGLGLEEVQSRRFGGLMLTLILATAGSAIAIPAGIAIALGRRFLIFPFRVVFAVMITFFRGVPLVVLLFATLLLANLLIPPGTNIDLIARVVVVIALHTGCRIAGAILAEWKAVPREQWEAAIALGLSHRESILLVVLPQVLRNLSPWIVIAVVGIIRETTLVVLAGLIDPVGLLTAIWQDANWRGAIWEVFIFVGLLYWSICYGMTCYSKYLERHLSLMGRARAIVADSTA